MTRTLRRTIGVVLLLVLGGGVRGLLVAQQAAPVVGTGFISGLVVEGGTTRPVPGATVTLSSATPRVPAREVIADAQGRYVFSNLSEGEFRLTARKTGWRAGTFGLATPVVGRGGSGEPIRLSSGERVRATVPVWRGALISGHVTDDAGEPLAGARVSTARWTSTRGHRSFVVSGGATTDDRGSFTLAVDPGEYMLSASSEQVRLVKGRPHVFRQMLYPRSFSPSGASTITVKSGEERNGLQIALSLESAFRVTGVLNRVDPGRMPQRLELRSIDREMMLQYPTRAIDPQGRFAFENLPAGRYVLQTPGGGLGGLEPTDNMELWARAAIDVAKSDLEISVDLRRPLLVSGRVHFDGTAPTPTPQDVVSIGVALLREEELPLTDVVPRYVPVGVDGRFTVAVTPGRYVVSSGGSIRSIQALRNDPAAAVASPAWTLRSGTLAGREVVDFPLAVTSDVSGLELTFTDRQPLLRGLVTSRQGRVESAQLMVFPTDEALWKEFPVGRRFRSIRLPDAGTFDLRNLPEGTYFVVAVRNVPQDYESWVTPDFLVALSRVARQVTLLEGQTTTQDVELSPSPTFNAALAPPASILEPTDRATIREVPAGTPSTGATISGIVLAAGSNTPIATARVGLTPGLIGVPNIGGAYTDDQGRFALSDVPPGTHTLYVSKALYVSTVFGATRPNDPGTPVTVVTGQQLSGLTIQLMKGAAIGGTVLDQNGQPLPNVQVNLRAYQWTARGKEPVAVRSPTVLGGAITNARGEYRIYGLAPGDYMVQATTQGLTSAMPLTTQADVDAATRRPGTGGAATPPPVEVIYTPMFYPDTPDPSGAQEVRLERGQERAIDFQFKLIPTATVTGTVRTSDGLLPSRLSVTLRQNDPLVPATFTRTGSVDSMGAFTIRGVPPGRHLLTATTTLAASPPQVGMIELFVDRDVSGIVLDAVPMATVTGTIRGELSAVRQPTVRLSLSPLPGTLVPINQSRAVTIGADTRFSIPNVPPGQYRFELTAPNNVVKPRVVTQLVGGRETIDTGFEVKGGDQIQVDVELTASEAQVGGRLRDRAGQPVTRPYVALFAKEPTAWTPPSRRIFGLRPDQNGRYLFPDVPAGDYLITILTDVESGEWFNPALLATLAPIASPVTVRRGDKLEIDLETR